jgi:hypothetical protein
MTPARAFEDARHRESEALVFTADRHLRAGRHDEARRSYALAAAPELELAREIGLDGSQPQLRSLFSTSAVTCLIRAGLWEQAMRAAHEFLARPELLATSSELEALLDDAQRNRDLRAAMGSDAQAAPLELRLAGGRVHRGIAPSRIVQEREEILEALVLRVADYKAGRPFRRAGRSVFASKFTFYEAPARAASYGIRFFVASAGPEHAAKEGSAPGTEVSPHAAVEGLIELASIAAEHGGEGIRAAVGNEAYSTAFIRAFRDLAPDGAAVESVSFSSPASGNRRNLARFSRTVRDELSRALLDERGDGTFTVQGVLKVVSLRGRRRIVVETIDGATYDMRLPDPEHDDAIGPKLNRKVHVSATRTHKDDGTSSFDAHDVVLIEDDDGATNLP